MENLKDYLKLYRKWSASIDSQAAITQDKIYLNDLKAFKAAVADLIIKKLESDELTQPAPERWRAKHGEKYYYFDLEMNYAESHYNTLNSIDNNLYNTGNYFKTQEEAHEAGKKIKAMLLQCTCITT